MKKLWIVCMAAVLLVLVACAPTAQADTTAPQETTTAPIQETTLAMEDPLITQFRELFAFSAEADRWYNYALKSYYAWPAMVDLFELFYNDPWNLELSQEEKDFLTGQGMDLETSAVHKYPVEKMDEVLQKYFGITFEETEGVGLDKMVYNPDTDSYYHLHGDFEAAYPVITEVKENSDGTIAVYYTEEMTGDNSVVQVQRNDDGTYLILNNLKLSGVVFADP